MRLDHLLSREKKGLTWGAVSTLGTGGTPCHYEVVKGEGPLRSERAFDLVSAGSRCGGAPKSTLHLAD